MRLLMDIVEPEHQAEAYLQFVRAKRIDGILLSGPRFDDDALQVLWNEGFPTVLIGQLPGSMFYSVDVDNYAAAKEAVAYLVNKGHSKIACITNAPISYTASADRLAGYQGALEESGIPYDEGLIRFGDFTVKSGFIQMQSLIDAGDKFTAVFVASDTVALGAKAALIENGFQIPEDIALVGFDDLPFAQYVDPPLTSVHVPAPELARKASEILIQLLGGNEPEQKQFILDTHMVIRYSCGSNGTGY
jgi:LacI family transcriptional regulator